MNLDAYPPGFEQDDQLRSAFIRTLTLRQLDSGLAECAGVSMGPVAIPRTLVRYWHDPDEIPDDVQDCMDSWTSLGGLGFELHTFCDTSAANYISAKFSPRECAAFAQCRHPAMRSDYFRMCFILAEGGLYVDADDVLNGDGWKHLFRSSTLKLQPLCYDIPTGKMIAAAQIWQRDLPTADRIFYVNNNPIAAPPRHRLVQRTLHRATDKLLGGEARPEIQSTTGPGNLSASLAAHARDLLAAGADLDFELIPDWNAIAETRWELSYRTDARNWRNMGAN